MKRITNMLNYEHTDFVGETDFGPSMAVPDMSLSIAQILQRHSRGLTVPGNEPIYTSSDDEENDLPDMRRLDLAERQELKERIDLHVRNLQEVANQKEADRLAAIKKTVDERRSRLQAFNDWFAKNQKPADDPAQPA